MIPWRLVLAALVAILILRISGFTSNTWLSIGFIGLMLVLVLLHQLPAFRRATTAAFVLWAVVAIGLPLLGIAFQQDWPILADAWQRRRLDSELRAAEWMDPVNYRARIGLVRYCQEIDRIQGEWLAPRFQKLASDIRARAASAATVPQPSAAEEQKLHDALKLIEEHRRECRARALGGGEEAGLGGKQAAAPVRDPATLCTKAIPVTVRRGQDVQLDHSDPYKSVVPPECRATFEVRRGRVFISTGGGKPVELGVGKGRHFPFRPPVVLSGDGTAVVVLIP